MRKFACVAICAGAFLRAEVVLGSASQGQVDPFLSPEIFGGRVRSPQGTSSGDAYHAPRSPVLDDSDGEEDGGSQSQSSDDDERFTPSPPPGQGHTYVAPQPNLLRQDLMSVAQTHAQLIRAFQVAQSDLFQRLNLHDAHDLPPEILDSFFQAFAVLQNNYLDLTNVVRDIGEQLDAYAPQDT